jgi:hypothetical protein
VFDARVGITGLKFLKLWRRLKALIVVGAALASALLFEILGRVLEKDEHALKERAFWASLVEDTYRNPWRSILILLASSISALILHLMFHWPFSKHPDKKFEQKRHADNEYGLMLCEYGEEFLNALKRLSRRNSGRLILTVDNASLLPLQERRVLEDLFEPPSGNIPFVSFARTHRLLFVTLDYEPAEWTLSSTGQVHTDNIPPFDDLQLREIYQNRYPDRSSLQFETVQHLAHLNVGLMFDAPPIAKEVIREFKEARRKRDDPGEFGYGQFMSYWSARDLEWISKTDILRSLEGIRPHLAAFGLSSPRAVRKMISFLERSRLVRSAEEGRLYFDAPAVQALRKHISEKQPDLLAQSHYFLAVTQPPPILDHSDVRRIVGRADQAKGDLDLKQSAWHAVQFVPGLLSDTKLNEKERACVREQIATLLLRAADLNYREGNIKESLSKLEKSLEWIRCLESSVQTRLLRETIEGLWRNYCISGDPPTRASIDRVSSEWPAVCDEPESLVHVRYSELMCGQRALSAFPASVAALLDQRQNTRIRTQLTAELSNLYALTECLLEIRNRYGFVVPALQDDTVTIPEPIDSTNLWFESALHQLRVAAAIHRSDDIALQNAIVRWRDRLLQIQASPTHLGTQAQKLYASARLWHLVCDVWRIRGRLIDDMRPAEQEAARTELAELCATLCPIPPGSEVDIHEYARKQAEVHYQTTLRIAAILHWRVLWLEIDFHFGILLLQHTPVEKQVEDPPWWNTWELLFNACLANEGELKWIWHTPAVHRVRWDFFKKQDLDTSLDDVYRTFQLVKDANYPSSVVLQWHSEAQTNLNNYGSTPEHRRRSAELFKAWAFELASLDEALPRRSFQRCLRFEKAHALTFASQAMRLAGDLDGASSLVDHAEQVLSQAVDDPTAADEDPRAVRDLRTEVRMERAWIIGQTDERKAESQQLIFEIWRDVERGDRHNANLLGSILGIEEQKKLLDDPWPPEGQEIYVDPNNPKVSLPQEWVAEPSHIDVSCRFEFRFWQLLSLVTENANPSSMELLLLAGLTNWGDQERFGETCLNFAAINLDRGYLRHSKPLVVEVLEAVAVYFEKMRPDGKNAIRALQLLVGYEPEKHENRLRYVQELRKHMVLLERELKARSTDQADWMALARRMDYLFNILVDSDQKIGRLADELNRRRLAPEQFLQQQRERLKALDLAQQHFQRKHFDMALRDLSPYLPPPGIRFILLDDLECLDLWLRSAVIAELRPREFDMRAAQLRDLACQYIRQFSFTVVQPDAQRLAMELLNVIAPQVGSAQAAAD